MSRHENWKWNSSVSAQKEIGRKNFAAHSTENLNPIKNFCCSSWENEFFSWSWMNSGWSRWIEWVAFVRALICRNFNQMIWISWSGVGGGCVFEVRIGNIDLTWLKGYNFIWKYKNFLRASYFEETVMSFHETDAQLYKINK